MTMTLPTSQQQRFGPPLNFDYAQQPPPAFSNPWSTTTASSTQHSAPYVQQEPHNLMAAKPQQPASRTSSASAPSMAPFASLPVAPAAPADLLSLQNRLHSTPAAYTDATYPATASPVTGPFTATSTAPYDALAYTSAQSRPSSTFAINAEAERRYSQQQAMQSQADERRSFADALDASHGMLAMSQETPRNIYGTRSNRSSVDSYGFPSTHSTSSSISSSGNFSSYYGDSVSDYSTAGSDIESVNSRTLPRPQGLITSQIPPAPQSMMGQFSSKVSSSSQKKHKCKVCDKRFTRPSSLQTHMYSHTGEKPFACEVEGCGRHFSVVSNLRRHRKVHRGDARSEAGSEDHHSD
ncbi:hypothetical protein L249_6377 [Ophiocordyceps polyrhachis-furcata BCC 54312]|uniref:C2H2-type domain-containing protein n=1 Tax=Ophiocordyceps polyrhachis-furcata BCC 54312 TaxID=1330021 RepID=A0A367LJK9_9HYPO|nr:hypothetical protein L249_6377 [Ophiocordyceps polyrhachis-furcata BCC 54312]